MMALVIVSWMMTLVTVALLTMPRVTATAYITAANIMPTMIMSPMILTRWTMHMLVLLPRRCSLQLNLLPRNHMLPRRRVYQRNMPFFLFFLHLNDTNLPKVRRMPELFYECDVVLDLVIFSCVLVEFSVA
jgi:hypothetical protein